MKTQAWGWLGAAVLAAGLNACYHDGGLEWVHRIVGEVGYNSAAVLALATGRVDQFIAEAQMVSSPQETASCRWATALARVQSRIARADNEFAHVQAMSAREQAQLARLEANRARLEAQVAAQTARLRVAATAFNPVGYSVRIPNIKIPDVKIPEVCPRLRVNVPRVPMVRFPAPAVHIELPGAGPV
jgi:septal ring factor EnvC (AmiA/AmiB activator)